MKVRFYVEILVAVVGALLPLGCFDNMPEVDLKITNWSQEYDDSLNQFDAVDINYRIKNIGDVDIASYSISAIVTCEDSSKHEDYDEGCELPVNAERNDSLSVNTRGKKAVSVELIEQDLQTAGG